MNNYAHKHTQKTGTFYMPKTIMRPEGFVTEDMAAKTIAEEPAVVKAEAKKAKATTKKEA